MDKNDPADNIRLMSHYDHDILAWSEQQAGALRRRAGNEIDWENVAEEIESVGRSQLSAVRSHITQALLHDLKAEAWPTALAVPHWRAEARMQRIQAAEAYTPSMAQRIDMAKLYRDALRGMPETMDGVPPLPVPHECPVALTELLADPDGG